MAILEASMVVYVAQVPSDHPMRTFTEVGQRVHPHCTGVGKALLTYLPDDVVRSILNGIGMPAYTPNTLTDPESLIHDLELTRYRGYGADEGEQEVGLRCFSVPVPNAPTPTAISVSGPTARVTLKSAEHVVPLLKHVASKLSVRTRQQGPEDQRVAPRFSDVGEGTRVNQVSSSRRPARSSRYPTSGSPSCS